jgi:acetyl esterase
VPLDPQIAELLAGLDTAGAASMSSTTPAQARAMLRMMAVDLRDPASITPVRSVVDQVISGPGGDLTVPF